MKIIKKIFLAVVMLFAFASCMNGPINLTGSAAPINPSQKKVLVAYFPEYSAKWRDDLELSFESRKWKVNEIDFWEVEKAINYNVHTEESFDVTTRLAKALEELVRK